MRKLLKYIMPVLSLVAAGCSSGEVDPDNNLREPRPDEVTLVLDVSVNGDATTRAMDPDRYDDPVGDFEKIESLRVMIVRDIQVEDNGNETGIIEGNRLVSTDEQGHPRFDNLEFKVQASEEKRIYLIANEKFLTPPQQFVNANPLNPTSSKFLDLFIVSKFSDEKRIDLSVLNDWTVNMAPMTVLANTDIRLPLSEIFTIMVGSKDDVTDERWFSHLFMTRCSAKARFFLTASDNYKADNAVVPVIESISISGLGTKEYVFPTDTKYSPDKSELISSDPHYAEKLKNAFITDFKTPDNNTVTYLIENVDAKVVKPSGDNPTALTDMLYFAESILEPGEKYNVTLNMGDGTSLTAPLETNILKVEGSDAVARNTYLPILINFAGAADVRIEVLPWTPEYYEFDFSDHVGMSSDGALTFTAGTFAEDGLNKETGRLVLRDYPLATTGTFTIGSPVGHRWDAYLITKAGEMNAIQFLVLDKDGNIVKDEDGNILYTDHLSGKVGEKVNFKVGATMSAGSVQREAIMQVMVTLDYGGITVPVNVMEGDKEYGADNITFIQNPK